LGDPRMNSELRYGQSLQELLDKVMASGIDRILTDGEEIIMDINDESVIISRVDGRLSVRIVDSHSPARLGRAK